MRSSSVNAFVRTALAVLLAVSSRTQAAPLSTTLDIKGGPVAVQKESSAQWTSTRVYETADWRCKLSERHPYPLIMLPGLSPGALTTRYMARRSQDAGYCVYQ
ncbi:hypothetical protein BGZ83_001764, partial [Gryganskiella cystojenkinii]